MKNEPTNVGKLSMIKAGTRLNIRPELYKGSGHTYTFPQLSKLTGIHKVIWSIGSCVITDYEKKVRFEIKRLNTEDLLKCRLGHRWSVTMELIN